MNAAIRFIVSALLAALVGGCIIIPLPVKDVSPHGLESAAKGQPGPITRFEPGRITRVDVLMALGPPERSWNHERFFVYIADTVDLQLFVAIGGYGGGAAGVIDIGCRYTLFVEFDNAGVLRRHEIVNSAYQTSAAHLARMMDAFAAGGSGNVD